MKSGRVYLSGFFFGTLRDMSVEFFGEFDKYFTFKWLCSWNVSGETCLYFSIWELCFWYLSMKFWRVYSDLEVSKSEV